jgi:hypothetical protein
VVWRWALAFAWIGSGVGAEIIESAIPVQIVASGGFCEDIPDEIIAAPDASGGQYENRFGHNDYVVLGDFFAAQRGLGVSVRIKLGGYSPGQKVTVRVKPPWGKIGTWDLLIGQDGELEFGRLPATGGSLDEGRYLLSVLDQGRNLFTYRIVLDKEEDATLCVPDVS